MSIRGADFKERLTVFAPRMLELLEEWLEEEVSPHTDLHDRTKACLDMVHKGQERIAAKLFIDAFGQELKGR